ncbi:MAG: alpha/beta fold hydrolase [Bacteroidia bacterium]|nr:alpha/beta fold hydrolase [Bacteroidia bacterium]
MRGLVGLIGFLSAQSLNLVDIWKEYRYYAQSHDFTQGPDGWYGQAESGAIYRISPALRAETVGKGAPMMRWIVAPQGKGWLFWTQLKRGFRHSSAGSIAWKRGEETRNLGGYAWREISFLPSGEGLIAADPHNLYLYRWDKDAWDTLTHCTGKVQAGTTDWLYEEEFGFTRAFEIAPSGAYVAYLSFDNTYTPTYPLRYYSRGSVEELSLPYPRAGEKNPHVQLHLYALHTQKDTVIYLDSTGGYIPWFAWSPMGDVLYFTHLRRAQNHFVLYTYEPTEKKLLPFFSDSTNGYFTWDDRQLLIWGTDRPELYYLAGGRGEWEIQRYDYKGRRQAIYRIPGLRKLVGYGGGKLFFIASGSNPIHQRIGYLPLDSKKPSPVWLTPDSSWAEAELAGELLWIRRSRFTDPEREEIRKVQEPEKVLILPDLNAHLREVKLPLRIQFLQFPNRRGEKLWGYLMLPSQIDSNQRYPVVLTFYGGPGSQQVADAFKNIQFYWQAYLVSRGYLVACVDGRGTALYPEKRFSIYRRLGLLETEDLADFVRWLRSFPFVGKVGAFGWSYGGYLAARLAFAAPDGLAAAVSVAPVTDWRLYDSAYTERFMDIPSANPQGYAQTALPPPPSSPLHIPLLLMHGDADDNVHVHHTYQLIENLLKIQPDAPIEWRIFPNQNHGIGGYRYRVYWEIDSFFDKHLR